MAETKGTSRRQAPVTPGKQADEELQAILEATDPAVETTLETLRVSEDHYFAAVHQEGNSVPTTSSSSTEI